MARSGWREILEIMSPDYLGHTKVSNGKYFIIEIAMGERLVPFKILKSDYWNFYTKPKGGKKNDK